jgi:hypothetical protein
MVLEAVYEEDSKDYSYGFRPGRSPHQAVERLRNDIMAFNGGSVLEADISDCFGSFSHQHIKEILDLRVRDGVIRRVVHKWLKAGVMESGNVWYPEKGSPQGGVISPLIANLYLHEVLDKWFEEEVQPRLYGQARQRQLRHSRVHSLLGPLAEEEVGGQAKDIQKATPARSEDDSALVQSEPAYEGEHTAQEAFIQDYRAR